MSAGAEKDPWVRVRDESELAPGMVVQLRPCAWCGRIETFWLGREKTPSPLVRAPSGDVGLTVSTRAFIQISRCSNFTPRAFATGYSVRDGKLFRLADSQLTDVSETTTAPRELEREKAGGR